MRMSEVNNMRVASTPADENGSQEETRGVRSRKWTDACASSCRSSGTKHGLAAQFLESEWGTLLGRSSDQ